MNSVIFSNSDLYRGETKSPFVHSNGRTLQRFRVLTFLVSLIGLAYLTASYSAIRFSADNYQAVREWNLANYSTLLFFVVVTLLSAGISSKMAVYAIIALLPVSALIPIRGFYISLSEVFITIFILIKLTSPFRMKKTLPVVLLLGLYFSCLLSSVGSPYVLSAAGLLLRFTLVVVFFVLCLSSSKSELLFRAMFYALLTTPFTAIAVYIGEGVFFESIVYGILYGHRAVYSAHYPIWLAFLAPLTMHFRLSKICVTMAFVVSALLVFISFSRSIIIAFSVVLILYLLYYRSNKLSGVFSKIVLFVMLFLGLVYVISIEKVLSFSTDKSSYSHASTEVRLSLISHAVDMFLNKPVLGNGFGAESTLKVEDVMGGRRPSVQITVFQALVELGSIGTLFYILLAYQALLTQISVLRNRSVPLEIKASMLIAFAGFISYSLNSTGLASFMQYALLLYVFLVHHNANKGFLQTI